MYDFGEERILTTRSHAYPSPPFSFPSFPAFLHKLVNMKHTHTGKKCPCHTHTHTSGLFMLPSAYTEAHVFPWGFGSHVIMFTEPQHSASRKSPVLFQHVTICVAVWCHPLVITWSHSFEQCVRLCVFLLGLEHICGCLIPYCIGFMNMDEFLRFCIEDVFWHKHPPRQKILIYTYFYIQLLDHTQCCDARCAGFASYCNLGVYTGCGWYIRRKKWKLC